MNKKNELDELRKLGEICGTKVAKTHDGNEIYDKAILYTFNNNKIKMQKGVVTIYKTLKNGKTIYKNAVFTNDKSRYIGLSGEEFTIKNNTIWVKSFYKSDLNIIRNMVSTYYLRKAKKAHDEYLKYIKKYSNFSNNNAENLRRLIMNTLNDAE